jgi:CRP/FNR family transcriptional regulator, polysaccharide utilization system transcription regulator
MKKKRIVLIEDNIDVRENTAEILELAGYEITTASNGKEGVELALKEAPDLIVCDIMMPVLDGYGVLHLLSKNTETRSIPFIFLTAKAERSDMRKGMEMGADDYITKPFDDTELLSAVESRLKRAESIRADFEPNVLGLSKVLGKIKGIDDIKSIAEKQSHKKYKKKDIIFNEGDSPNGLYLLTKGKVKLYKSHELGKDLIIKLLQPDEFFGYMALIENLPYTMSAEALEDCELTIFSKEDFFLLLSHPQVMYEFLHILSNNITEEQEKLISLAYSSVRKRTANALLEIRSRYHDMKSDKPFSMAVTRDDLATMVGTATESLIRTLSDFRSEGLVEINGSTITVMQVEKLEKMRS